MSSAMECKNCECIFIPGGRQATDICAGCYKQMFEKYESFYKSTSCLYAEGVEFMTKEQIYEEVKDYLQRTADGEPLVR